VSAARSTYGSSQLRQKKPDRLRAFLICVLIASFLWIAHSLNAVYTYTFQLPVSFKNVPRNKKPLAQIPETLSVAVKASGLKLFLILLKRPFHQMEIDFNSLKAGNHNQNYILSSSDVNFKSIFRFDTRIKHITPDTLYFSEKAGYQKNVPIRVPLSVKCKEGFGFRKPTLNPSFLAIWGDSVSVSRTDTIYTQPLSLHALDRSYTGTLELIRPNPGIYTAISQTEIFIEVDRLLERSVTVEVKDTRSTPGRQVNIYPSRVKVRFTSVQNSFSESDTMLLRASIDSEHMNRASRKYRVVLSGIPPDITIMDVEPPEVEALIIKNP
jgi:hypothetical protein